MGAFIKVLAERPGLCLLAGDGAVEVEGEMDILYK